MDVNPAAELDFVCKDIQSRQRYRPAAKGIADVLSRLMARRGYAQQRTTAECEAAWRTAAGPVLAEHTCPGNVRRGVLEIIARNSAVVQELTFQKKKLLQKLVSLVPDQKIRDLRFRVSTSAFPG